MKSQMANAVVLSLTAVIVIASMGKPVAEAALPGEWPQWRGPDRNGISKETGLLKEWPQGGPRLLWKAVGLGGGYSTPSVANGRVYGMGYRGDEEVIWSLDGNNGGRGLWITKIADANHHVGYAEGPRSTPTVEGNRLYAIGVSGDLVCADAATGNAVWQKSLVTDFGGRVPGWGYSESPLIDGDRVVVTPGGRAATMVALNKNNGELIWRAQVPQGDGAQYSSAIVAEVGGIRQYVNFLRGGVISVSARDGQFFWRYDNPANGTANISTPIFHNSHVFAASGYNTGGGLVRLMPAGNVISATEVYFTRQMQNHHGGMVLVNGFLYGFDASTLTCLNFLTGEVAWANRSTGKGSLVCADGHLYVRGERGTVALVEANPSAYVEKSQFEQPERSGRNAWPHPVVAGGRLYLRDQDILLCYDVKG